MAQSVADFLAERFEELEPMGYYREVFPQGVLERKGEYKEGKYCGIAIQINDEGKARRIHITDELEQLPDLINSNEFTMLSPVQFAGRNASNKNARYLQAIQFDLDFIREDKEGNPRGLVDLLYQTSITENDPFDRLPKPTYIIASSYRNIHVVYLLDHPLAMHSLTVQQVRSYRKALTAKLWNSYISSAHQKPQYETSPVQAFRLVGSGSKTGGTKVRCFRVGESIDIDTLNKYVDDESKITNVYKKGKYTLEESKKLFPEWYSKRIENNIPAYSWKAHEGLYRWFKNQLPKISVGHRYHYLMCLCAYAIKCGIDQETLYEDVMFARSELDKLSPPENPLTISDATKALQTFTEQSRTTTRETISRLCGIEILPQKRNGRSKENHLKLMRDRRKSLIEIGEDRAKGGRPQKADIVIQEYKKDEAKSISAIARAANVDIKTARKWVRWYQDHADQN